MGAGTKKRIMLVVDRAGWHTAKKKLKVPEGIDLESSCLRPAFAFPRATARREAVAAL